MLSPSSKSSKSSQRFLRISAIHHNMTHFISESTVHEYQYSIEHFPETSSLMTSGYGTNYDFSICSRSPHSSLSLKELQTSFPDARMPCQVTQALMRNHKKVIQVNLHISYSTCISIQILPYCPICSFDKRTSSCFS